MTTTTTAATNTTANPWTRDPSLHPWASQPAAVPGSYWPAAKARSAPPTVEAPGPVLWTNPWLPPPVPVAPAAAQPKMLKMVKREGRQPPIQRPSAQPSEEEETVTFWPWAEAWTWAGGEPNPADEKWSDNLYEFFSGDGSADPWLYRTHLLFTDVAGTPQTREALVKINTRVMMPDLDEPVTAEYTGPRRMWCMYRVLLLGAPDWSTYLPSSTVRGNRVVDTPLPDLNFLISEDEPETVEELRLRATEDLTCAEPPVVLKVEAVDRIRCGGGNVWALTKPWTDGMPGTLGTRLARARNLVVRMTLKCGNFKRAVDLCQDFDYGSTGSRFLTGTFVSKPIVVRGTQVTIFLPLIGVPSRG